MEWSIAPSGVHSKWKCRLGIITTLVIMLEMMGGGTIEIENTRMVTYQVTRDFIFQSRVRRDLTYNPEYVDIAKKVDLKPLAQIAGVLEELLGRYNNTCGYIEDTKRNSSMEGHFVHVPGPNMTVMKGIETCKRLDMKLLELRTEEDVSKFISEKNPQTHVTPAAIYYDKRLRTFVFFSDKLKVKDSPMIQWTMEGYHIQSFSGWASYGAYFGKYMLKGGQIFLDFATSDSTYDHVYCQERLNTPLPGAESCWANLQFIKDIANTNLGYVEQLRSNLALGYKRRKVRSEGELNREKRASFILAATVGGVFGALSSRLLSEVIPQESLASSAAETERILDVLGERTNVLDVNQKRMAVLIERIQRQMQQEISGVTHQLDLSTTHLQINSILIHLGDHLSYLYHLLSGRETGESVNLALTETEREQILQRRANITGGYRAVAGTPIRHRFQMIDEDILCVVLEVPIRTSTTSSAAIRVYPFPIIKKGLLGNHCCLRGISYISREDSL